MPDITDEKFCFPILVGRAASTRWNKPTTLLAPGKTRPPFVCVRVPLINIPIQSLTIKYFEETRAAADLAHPPELILEEMVFKGHATDVYRRASGYTWQMTFVSECAVLLVLLAEVITVVSIKSALGNRIEINGNCPGHWCFHRFQRSLEINERMIEEYCTGALIRTSRFISRLYFSTCLTRRM